MSRHTSLPLLLGILFASSTASAQTVGGAWGQRLTVDGPAAGDGLGACVADIGDQDGDGIADLLIGAPNATNSAGDAEAGVLFAVSGADGSTLWTWEGSSAGHHMGAAVAGLGDMDGDGVGDWAVGIPGYVATTGHADDGMAYLSVSGIGGVSVTTSNAGDELGAALAPVDVNGDGILELAVGVPGYDTGTSTDAGAVWIYSPHGISSAGFWIDGTSSGNRFGEVLSSAGDANGDGNEDLLVGAPQTDVLGISIGDTLVSAGSARLYLCAAYSGTLWQTWEGSFDDQQLGAALAPAGDLEGDGYAEYLIGAPGDRDLTGSSAGAVYLRSGSSGALLSRIRGIPTETAFGTTLAGGQDLDGDGVPDFAVGTCNSDLGLVQAYSGATLRPILSFEGGAVGDGDFGAALTFLSGTGSSSAAEIAIGSPTADAGSSSEAGRIEVVSFFDCLEADTETFSVSVGAGTIDFEMDFPDSEAGMFYALLLSESGTGPVLLGGVEVPLTVDSLLISVLSGPPPDYLFDHVGVLDADGDASAYIEFTPRSSAACPFTTADVLSIAALSLDSGWTPRLASVAAQVEFTH